MGEVARGTSPVFLIRNFMKIINLIGLLLAFSGFAWSQKFEQKISIPPLTENSTRYFYVPFEVPENTKSITLSYSYDKKGGSNTLDLGVFDSDFKADQQDLRGFREWSGGRRNEIFVSDTKATNGYLPGKIQSGRWQVILGLYKVAPEGVEVTIKVTFNHFPESLLNQPKEESDRSFSVANPSDGWKLQRFNGLNWYRGDLHIHTFHSDGNWTFPMIFAYARAQRLDFIGLTDHNTRSHHAEIDEVSKSFPKILALRGEEVTTYGGHINVWGIANK